MVKLDNTHRPRNNCAEAVRNFKFVEVTIVQKNQLNPNPITINVACNACCRRAPAAIHRIHHQHNIAVNLITETTQLDRLKLTRKVSLCHTPFLYFRQVCAVSYCETKLRVSASLISSRAKYMMCEQVEALSRCGSTPSLS